MCAPVCLLALCAAPLAQAALVVNAAHGTVTDTTTGLVWDQCAYGLSGPTCASGTAIQGNWATALAQATAANAAVHKGFADWRVPNRNELESIVKLDAKYPAIDTTAFPNTPTDWFWTSTTFAPSPALAWAVFFGDGDTIAGEKTDDFNGFVRLVRGGQSLVTFDRVGTTSHTAPAPSGSSASGNVTTALAGGGATCAFGSVAYQNASAMSAAPPAQVSFPYGLVNFTTTTCSAGGAVNITLTYPGALPAGTQLYKYGPATAGAAPTWYVHPATVAGNTITFSVTDNGQGDNNPASGVITDPAGAGVVVGGSGGGIAGVPTLSEWAMALMVALMALVAVRRTRR